jgi:hypothetical protein
MIFLGMSEEVVEIGRILVHYAADLENELSSA